MRIKTCIVTGQYPPQLGGVAHSAHRVAGLLERAGLTVHVVAFQKHPQPLPFDESVTTAEEGGILVHRVKVHHPVAAAPQCEAEALTRYNREMYQAMDHFLARHRYDVLHGFFLYPGGFIAGLAGRTHGVKTIASIRGNDVGKYVFDPHRIAFIRSALQNADAVTSVATHLTTFADRAVTPIAGKARTVLNSVDFERLVPRARPDIGLSGTVIGTAGLFRYKKGLVYLFKALASLDGTLDYTMLLAGDYFHEEDRQIHERYLEHFGLTGRTVVTGRIAPDRVGDYLQLFDILVFPSLFSEGCPLSLLEGMALGKAVIGTRVAAIPEVVRDRENGLLVDPGSSKEIAAAVLELVREPGLAARLGGEARKTALTMTAEREAREWLEVYESLGG